MNSLTVVVLVAALAAVNGGLLAPAIAPVAYAVPAFHHVHAAPTFFHHPAHYSAPIVKHLTYAAPIAYAPVVKHVYAAPVIKHVSPIAFGAPVFKHIY